jgi:hypothetical protein
MSEECLHSPVEALRVSGPSPEMDHEVRAEFHIALKMARFRKTGQEEKP